VVRLVDAKAELDTVDGTGYTALIYTAVHKYKRAMTRLIEAGANLEYQNKCLFDAEHYARENGILEDFEAALKKRDPVAHREAAAVLAAPDAAPNAEAAALGPAADQTGVA